MHDDSPTRSVAAIEADTDRALLAVLLDDPGPWAVEEVERELSDPVKAVDGLARLGAAGLVHRLEGFVFASRAAKQAHAIYHG